MASAVHESGWLSELSEECASDVLYRGWSAVRCLAQDVWGGLEALWVQHWKSSEWTNYGNSSKGNALTRPCMNRGKGVGGELEHVKKQEVGDCVIHGKDLVSASPEG
jgi:hypothetical protein